MQNEIPENKALLRKELINQATSVFAKELFKLQPRTREIVLAYCDNPSITREELAQKFKCSTRWISKLLNSSRIVQVFKVIGRRKLERLVPQGTDVFARLVAPAMVEKNPAEARKAAETILRESKVLGIPELRLINQFENMSHSDLCKFMQDAGALPEPAIDAEIVVDERSDGNAAA